MTLHIHNLLLSSIGDTRAPAARESTRYVTAGAKELPGWLTRAGH